MHQATAALSQLHYIDIAHQDVKPSNLLLFDSNTVKMADLGSASLRQSVPDSDDRDFAGDRTYAPPEVRYGAADVSWRSRRLADMYMLGSIVSFLYTGVAMTPLLLTRMSTNHRPEHWIGSYQEILPYVTHAFAGIVNDIRQRHNFCADAVATTIHQLCHPDPAERGHPKDRRRHQYALERYISQFDLLARKAEWSFRTANQI